MCDVCVICTLGCVSLCVMLYVCMCVMPLTFLSLSSVPCPPCVPLSCSLSPCHAPILLDTFLLIFLLCKVLLPLGFSFFKIPSLPHLSLKAAAGREMQFTEKEKHKVWKGKQLFPPHPWSMLGPPDFRARAALMSPAGFLPVSSPRALSSNVH